MEISHFHTITNSTSITFSYTGQKLTLVNDTYAGETHSFSYDSSYRMSSNTQGPRGTLNYTYDAADRIATHAVSGGGPTATYSYYEDDSLKTIDWSAVSGTFTYEYTLNGQYDSITFPNGQHRDYSVDDQGRLTQIATIHPTAGNLATYDYAYDFNHTTGQSTMLGQRTSIFATVPNQNFSNHETKYYYDGSYQLTRADYPNPSPFNGEVDEWSYDPIGNRLMNKVNGAPANYSYYVNPGNSNNSQRLESDGSNTYTYDDNGNMISKSGSGGNFTFTYDYENRLISISGSATASYTYDYLGRRTSKNVGGTTHHIYNGQDLIAERGISVADFVFGPAIDEPLAMQRNSTIYYFNIDGLGSSNLLNDSGGTIQDQYLFDAWGVTRAQTVSVSNPFGYTSREFAETGMLFYRARYYNPTIGRFASEDPLRFRSGINFYPYVLNSPARMIDPLGLFKIKWEGPFEMHWPQMDIDGKSDVFNININYQCKCEGGFWRLEFTVEVWFVIYWKNYPEECRAHETKHINRSKTVIEEFFEDKSKLRFGEKKYAHYYECERDGKYGQVYYEKFDQTRLGADLLSDKNWMHFTTVPDFGCE